jgi:acyl-CoA thioesterase-2
MTPRSAMIGHVAETLTDILALLDLEPAGPDAFDGAQPGDRRNVRVFGAQVAAQALMAAGRTARDRAPHSLHLYFLRPGRPAGATAVHRHHAA